MTILIRRALVTGASAGLGAEFARQLADRGVDLTLVARRREALHALAARLPVDAEVVPVDLTTADGVRCVADRLRDTASPIDLALADFARGRAVSIPGFSNKVSAIGADLIPSIATRRVSKAVHDRFSR